MNKKGQYEAIIDVASMILIVLFLIGFSIIFIVVHPKSEVSIKTSADENQCSVLLLNFLKMNVDGKQVADLIILENYDVLGDSLKRLPEACGDDYGLKLINADGSSKSINANPFSIEKSEAKLPGKNGDIKVVLTSGMRDIGGLK